MSLPRRPHTADPALAIAHQLSHPHLAPPTLHRQLCLGDPASPILPWQFLMSYRTPLSHPPHLAPPILHRQLCLGDPASPILPWQFLTSYPTSPSCTTYPTPTTLSRLLGDSSPGTPLAIPCKKPVQ